MWFKVDDGFHASRKLLSIPKRHRFAAAGLWAVAGSWCGSQLTDGNVPDYMIDEWGAPPAAPQALVDAGLWERVSGGYVFRNWVEYQPSKEDVDAERAASRERMRQLRARRKGVTGDTSDEKTPESSGSSGGVTPNAPEHVTRTFAAAVRNPDPTRPDPTHREEANASSLGAPQAETPKRPRTKGTRLPDNWEPSPALRDAMAAECPHVDQYAQFLRFRDHWHAQPGQRGVKVSWDATYRNWIRRAAETTTRTTNGQPRMTKADKARQAQQAGLDLERMMGIADQGNRELTWQGSPR